MISLIPRIGFRWCSSSLFSLGACCVFSKRCAGQVKSKTWRQREEEKDKRWDSRLDKDKEIKRRFRNMSPIKIELKKRMPPIKAFSRPTLNSLAENTGRLHDGSIVWNWNASLLKAINSSHYNSLSLPLFHLEYASIKEVIQMLKNDSTS